MKGFLRKRGNVWYTTFDLPRLPNQPRRQKCVRLGRTSKAEAQERERQVLRRNDEGSLTEESTKTVGDLLDAWLTDLRPTAKSQTISPTTYQRYASIVKLHLKPHLGAVSLRRLSAGDITTAYGRVRAKGLSGQSCLHTHRVLHTALEYGTKTLGWLRANPAAAVRSPKVTRKTAALDGNTVPILLEATKGTRFEYPVALTATTGLRRGELLALRWSKSVDFERRRLIVAESLEETKILGLRFKAPKSGKLRVLPLADVAVPLLRSHRARQDAERQRLGSRYNDNDLVFCNPDGTPWPPETFTKQFAQVTRSIGMKGFRFHDLRHAFATLTLKNGTSVNEVSQLLGHSSPVITLSTYAHVIEGVARDAVNLLANSLISRPTGTDGA
ncbi:MAG: site-specific integrase [Candidatus Eremiobacteraeota bacterium]|nr:site-specific integrase [Candidatus Eremiobacteraeota bacterium]MBV9056310.1 site-specific integrase [Candidatus Eremiobacteraeota bacterium]MBV9699604.1 site-specific integrase [Candidatus Eremiobacteraeota bacterium]